MTWNRLSRAEQLNLLLQYVKEDCKNVMPERRLSLFLTLMECYAIGYLHKRYAWYSDTVIYSEYDRKIVDVRGLILDKYGKFILRPYVRATSRFWDTLPVEKSDPHEFRKPWVTLDTGRRLDRLHQYAELYPGLTPAERTGLLMTLMEAFYTGYFDVPERVIYDSEFGLITRILGLTDHVRISSGFRKFRWATDAAKIAKR